MIGRPLGKSELLERIQTEHEKLSETLQGLSEPDMLQLGVTEEWSVKDVLAHLTDWEQRLLNWYQAGLRGQVPPLPAPGMTWAELPALNAQIVERHRRTALNRIMADYSRSYQQVLKTLQAIPDSYLVGGYFAWTGKKTLADYVAAYTCEHYRWANNLIRKWTRTRERAFSKT